MHCPACNSKLGRESLLGSLGLLKHFRCRRCGMVFSKRGRARNIFGRLVRAAK